MSRALKTLHRWAELRAHSDPDADARALWAHIRDDVAAYLARDTGAPAGPGAHDVPLFTTTGGAR